MKLRVLQISTAMSWRGGEQQLAYLLEELKDRIELFVLCSRGSAIEEFCQHFQIPFLSVRKKGGVNLRIAKKLSQLCKNEKYTCMHSHDAHAHTHAFISALFFGNKTPLIVSRRVDFPIQKNWLSKLKYNHNSVKKILCVSEAIRSITAKGIVNHQKLYLVYDGINIEKFSSPHPKLRRELGLSSDAFIVGNTSALADHKDYFTFLAVADRFILNNENAHFVIIGKGPMEDEIKSFSSKLKGSKNIHFVGFRNDVSDILGELNVFLITSKTEGLGTSILDALAAKVPVVATRAGGIPEIIKNEQNGLLCDVGDVQSLVDCLARLKDNKGLRKQLSESGRHSLLPFTKSEMAANTLRHYEDLK